MIAASSATSRMRLALARADQLAVDGESLDAHGRLRSLRRPCAGHACRRPAGQRCLADVGQCTRRGSSAACSAPGWARSGPARTGWCRFTMSHSSSSSSRSRCVACRRVILREQLVHLHGAGAAGMHLPHDSSMQNSMKNRATSTMHAVSSITIMPPEPMIEPSCGQRLVVDRQCRGARPGCSRRTGRRSAPP